MSAWKLFTSVKQLPSTPFFYYDDPLFANSSFVDIPIENQKLDLTSFSLLSIILMISFF